LHRVGLIEPDTEVAHHPPPKICGPLRMMEFFNDEEEEKEELPMTSWHP
jgi:hypothetical protein